MQDDKLKKNNQEDDDIAPELREAIAAFFEQRNGGEIERQLVEWLATSQMQEWQQAEALLTIPQRALEARPSVDSAWQKFRVRSFEVAPVAETASLGNYVASALAQSEQTTLKESGLSKDTLEALRADQTPLENLKNYELTDYANLARRYQVKESAFPRMLNWLKGLGKSLTMPSGGMSRGMVFARDEETRQQGLSESQLADSLNAEKPHEPNEEPAQEPEQ